ncbi:nuclear factor NF-kappa-B p110 subunit [Prorops nasuta]|uniref:nuclear factor NF-kappa-B p110 subunit n=1 Tax=Prorops nasuta TaxID=863751 RepID=UPI0034CD1329
MKNSFHGCWSPYNNNSMDSQGNQIMSSFSDSLSPQYTDGEYLTLNNATVFEKPWLQIVEQPMEKFRFRYKSEMAGTHGSLVGVGNASARKRSPPTVKLRKFEGEAIIRCTLVTSDEKCRIPHAHRLVRKHDAKEQDDPHHIEVSPKVGFLAYFSGMGIIHTAKKNIKSELQEKMMRIRLEECRQKDPCISKLSNRDEVEIRTQAEIYQKRINLNSVALCFQAFVVNQHNIMIPITEPVYSNAINNLKSALTGELKICRIDKIASTVDGDEEVFILVEKVGKKNIKVKFYELNENDDEIWSAYGRFSELDVHHQYAIVFRTPPYKDLTITSPVEVFLQLERPSDGDCSYPMSFTYKPSDRLKEGDRKRPRTLSSNTDFVSTPTFNKDEANQMIRSVERSINLSDEIRKYLTVNPVPSEELREYFEGIDFDEYVKLLYNSEEVQIKELMSDGISKKQQVKDDKLFARNKVYEAMKTLKIAPDDANEIVGNLLKTRSTFLDTPLHSALRYEQRQIVENILLIIATNKEFRSIVDIQNTFGKTPLHLAVISNQPDVVKALLMLDADPNIRDENGALPLHSAAESPESGVCVDELLADKRTLVNVINDKGWNALQIAAKAGSYDAVESLLKANIDVNSCEKSSGRTALHIAVEGGHISIVELLLKEPKLDVNKTNLSGNTALHSAVVSEEARAKEICKVLMQHGANPNIKNCTPAESQWNAENDEKIDSIKVEVESEDECNDIASGTTSLDLASNKPEILQILNGYEAMEEEEMKQEIDEYEADRLFSSEQLDKLALILNKTNGWIPLAYKLHFDYLMPTLQKMSCPSRFLLNCIAVTGNKVTLQEIYEVFCNIKEKEAANVILGIINKT